MNRWIQSGLIIGIGMTSLTSCINKRNPCATPAIYRIEGVNLVVRDKTTSANLMAQYDSFEVKGFNGVIPYMRKNDGDTSFFAGLEELPKSDLYFRIKPSLNIDTIAVKYHTVAWDDGNCSGTTFVTDSVLHNGVKLGPSNTFYYQP